MTSSHDRFETLAGAIALGEATTGERERFDAHARACAACRDDAHSGPLLRALVATARDQESWRPSIRDAVFARIHERRSIRSRFAIGALGWAFAASVLLNAAIVSGVASHIGHALRERVPASEVVATRISIERRPAAAVPTPVPAFVARSARAIPGRPLPKRVASVARRVARTQHVPRGIPRSEVTAAPALETASAIETGVDDLLAGLDLASGGGLAAATSLRCHANSEGFGAPQSCPANDVRR